MNKIFSVLLLVTFSLGIISCSNEDQSNATSQIGQVLDQPNSNDDEEKVTLPVTSGICVLIDNSVIDNSTVDNSTISDNSSIKDSTVKNCSTVTSSIVDNSSTVNNSTISSSTINSSYICAQSTIDNSTIDNTTVCNSSTVQGGSTVRNSSSVCYATIDNSTIDNSTVCNGTVTMTIENRIVQNQVMTESDAPTVISTSPTDDTDNVSRATYITVTFSEIMDNTSITTNTANTSCSGTFQVSSNNFSSCIKMTASSPYTSDNETFTVDPSDNLSNNTTFKIRVTTGVKDPSGNSMSSDNTTGTGFTTQAGAPPTAPIVSGTTPTNDTTPTWSWSAGGGGNGTYRYKLDNSDLTSGATETTSTSYTPVSVISDGSHTLYVQERDAAGNWSSSGSSTIVIDTTVPTITSFTSTTNNGSYKSADTVNITATASEAVVAGNTITATLDTSDNVTLTAAANGTTLVGTYTVGAGDNSNDLTVSSFSIGTVTDIAGNAMAGTDVPVTNIASGSAIVIDTTVPTITSFTSTTSNGSYKSAGEVNITATASEAVVADNTITATLDTRTM